MDVLLTILAENVQAVKMRLLVLIAHIKLVLMDVHQPVPAVRLAKHVTLLRLPAEIREAAQVVVELRPAQTHVPAKDIIRQNLPV